jgi:hypothetical protein
MFTPNHKEQLSTAPVTPNGESCGEKIRLITPVYFRASKLEAFAGRGKNDYQGSRDFADLIAAVDGRADLIGEIWASAADVRSYLAEKGKNLIWIRGSNDALPGHLPPDAASQECVPIVILKLEEIASV